MNAQRQIPPRLRRRRRLLGWSAPVVLLALLAAALLLGVTAGNHLARAAHDEGDHAGAAERYTYQQRWTARGIEPWKAWFNAGTAELGAGRHFPATEQLAGALARVPAGTTDTEGAPDPSTPECRVRTNLSLALEAMGDDAAGNGDRGMAEQYYTEAMETVGPCSSDGEPETDAEEPEEPQSPQDRAEQRQRDKRDQAAEQPDQQDPPQPEPPQEEAPQDDEPEQPQDPRLEDLEERNQEAERERSEQQQERGGGSGGGQNW